MPTKTYKYNVIINANVDSGGVSKGGKQVEESLSRWEKRALKAIKSIEKALDQMKKVEDKVFSDNSRSSGGESRKWTSQHQAVLKATTLVNRYEVAIDRLGGKQTELKKLNQQLSQPGVAANIDKTTQALLREKAAIIDQIKETKVLEREQAKLNREKAAKSRKRIESATTAGGGIQNAGLLATAIVTAPIVAGFYAAIKVGAEYEASMNMLQAVTSATAEDMKRAGNLAVKLGADLSLPGVSAKDAAEAMTELGKAGMTVSQAMDAAKGTLQLATAANIPAAQAAEITANALNMFSLNASEAGRVADLLAGSANASSAEITDVALSLQQSGAVFANAKVPIEDVVTLIGEMANQGIKGSDAGTSLKTMMQRLQSPTDNAASAMKALNVEIYDQQGKMKPMRDIIGQFENSLKGLSQEQKDQALNTIFGADAVRAATIVFSQGAEGFDKMKVAVMRANAAQELAAARTKGLAGAYEAFNSQIETVGLIISEQIKEPLTTLVIYAAMVVSKVTDLFLSLPESAQTGIAIFFALAAAVGPVITIVGTAVIGVAEFAAALTALTGAATVGAALGTLAPIIAGIIAVIALLTAGVTAAVGVAYTLWEAWDNGWGAIASIVAVAVGLMMTGISPLLGLPVLIGAVAVTIYKIWETNFGGLRDFAIAVWNKIVEIFNAGLERLVSLVNLLGGKVIGWWRQNFPLIKEISQKVTAQVTAIVSGFLQGITSFWQAHGQKILAVVNTIWNAVKGAVVIVATQLLNWIRLFLQLLNGDWSGAWETFLKIVKQAAKNLAMIWIWIQTTTVKALVLLVKTLFNYGGKASEGFTKAILKGLLWVVTEFIKLPYTLVKLVPSMFAAGLSIGSAIWDGIKEAFSGGGDEGGTSGGIPDVPFDVTALFSLPDFFGGGGSSPWMDKLTGGVDKLGDSMKKLGDNTETSGKKMADFDKRMDKSKKSATSRNSQIQDANFDDILTAMRAGTMSQESGGKLSVQNKRTNATGLFQVMPENIPNWTANTPGVGKMSIEEFRKNRDAQIKVFNKYMGDYLRQGMKLANGDKAKAVRMAAAAWYGGPDDFRSYDNAKRFRKNEPSFREYTTSVLSKTKRGLKRTGRGSSPSADTEEKTLDQLADENIFNDAKSRVQTLIQLSKELGVALTVPQDVTTTNEALIIQQQTELQNLQDLKKKRGDVLEMVQKLGLTESDYARTTIAEADASLQKLSAIEESQKLVNSTYDGAVKKLEEMEAASGGALTPLQDFNLQFERLFTASGLSREEFERLNPKLAETRDKLQAIADIDLANKVAENFKKFHENISREIQAINKEIEFSGITDPSTRKKAERTEYIKNYIQENFADADLFTQLRVAADLMAKFAGEDTREGINKAADATKSYEDKVKDLNDALRGNIELSELQKLEIELTTGSLKELTEEQKNNLRVLQEQVDVQKTIDRYNEKVRTIGDNFGQIFADSFTALFTKGIGGALDALQKGLKNFFKNLWLGIVDQFAKRIQQSISDKIFDIFKKTGGGANQGGGVGVLTTPPPNSGFNFQTGAAQSRAAAAQTGSLITLPNGEKAFQVNGSAPSFTSNAVPTALGGAQRIADSGLPLTVANYGGGGERRRKGGGAYNDPNKKFNLKNLFGKGGIFGEKGFGFNSGTIGTLGVGAGMLGSVIGGGAGAGLMGAASGIGLASSLSSILGISALGGPVGLAIGAAIGAIVGIGGWLFGKTKQRKADEKTRTAALLDASGSIDKLIKGVQSDKIDGDQALEQADEIRKNYLEQVGQLKDKKTRRIALAAVSGIDSKINNLKAVVAAQKSRKERLATLAPTFAGGGAVSKFIGKNYRHNPLGYISGAGTPRSDSIEAFFPEAGRRARISNTEYVLDAETTKNIGVYNLDRLRAGKGRDFGKLVKNISRATPNYSFADGGAVSEGGLANAGMNTSGGGGKIELKANTSVYITQDGNGNITDVRTETILDTPQGKQKLEQAVADIIYQNRQTGKIPTALNRVSRGQG